MPVIVPRPTTCSSPQTMTLAECENMINIMTGHGGSVLLEHVGTGTGRYQLLPNDLSKKVSKCSCLAGADRIIYSLVMRAAAVWRFYIILKSVWGTFGETSCSDPRHVQLRYVPSPNFMQLYKQIDAEEMRLRRSSFFDGNGLDGILTLDWLVNRVSDFFGLRPVRKAGGLSAPVY